MSKTVAVLKGGWSSEREVSLTSGTECATALRKAGYAVTEIDLQRDIGALLEALEPRPDVVFNALHGRYGEDGHIQAILNILEIPYTHSGMLASAIAMDKARSKEVFKAAGLQCPEGHLLRINDLPDGILFDPPYVIKPNNEGSSVGVRIVLPGDNRPVAEDWVFGEVALVEPYIPGRELTVAVLGETAMGVTELRPHQGFYDYEAKYTDGKTVHLCPAPIPDSIAQQAMESAVMAHRALGCRGASRSDFRYDDTQRNPGDLLLLELNTQPGMTPLSLVPEQAAHAGMSFEELVSWLVENAACDA
jgi:D-alanine-D-alanine ligase